MQEQVALPAILHILKGHGNEPQTVASGIAAVYKLCRRNTPEDILKDLSFDPQMRALAALQHVPAKNLDLSDLPVNIDRASPDILKLALLLVGLGRSLGNLLNPRHTDGQMVRVLSRNRRVDQRIAC